MISYNKKTELTIHEIEEHQEKLLEYCIAEQTHETELERLIDRMNSEKKHIQGLINEAKENRYKHQLALQLGYKTEEVPCEVFADQYSWKYYTVRTDIPELLEISDIPDDINALDFFQVTKIDNTTDADKFISSLTIPEGHDILEYINRLSKDLVDDVFTLKIGEDLRLLRFDGIMNMLEFINFYQTQWTKQTVEI